MDADVVIAGAGPVGLLCGIELARRGVSVHIVEKRAQRSPYSKALGVFARTLETLDRAGLADQFIKHGRQLQGAVVHGEGKELGRIDTADLDSPFKFILCIPQSETERFLEDEANRLGVTIERGCELTDVTPGDDGVAVQVRNSDGAARELATPWLVACDGAHSTVRHCLGLAYEGEDIDRWFMFADAHSDWPLAADRLNMFFSSEGVSLALQLPEEGVWRVILSMPEGETPPEEPSLQLIEETFEQRTGVHGRLREARWITRFTIRQRLVQQFRVGRILLAGDAAHSHSPAGGQGMNTGLQDAENLAWKLAAVINRSASESLLDTYETERQPVARAILRGTGLLTKMATLSGSISQFVRNNVLDVALDVGFIEDRVVRTLSELHVGYRDSPLTVNDVDHWPRHAPAGGERAPVVVLRSAEGEDVRLSTLCAGAVCTVVVFDDAIGAARLDEWARNQGDTLVRVVLVQRSDAISEVSSNGVVNCVDDRAAAHERYNVDSPCMFGVRADGVIAFRSQDVSIDPVEAWLGRVGV